MTRYQGAAPNAIEEAVQAKKGVLPTEFGQAEGMKGVVFLVDQQSGATSFPCGKTWRQCARVRTMRLAFARK